MSIRNPAAVVALILAAAAPLNAAITSTVSSAGLDAFMGTSLLPVVDDGSPIGTEYGHPPAFTPGSALATPIGTMGFGPTHERTMTGSPVSSGSFTAVTTYTGPIAGSTLYAPAGANALDFYLVSEPGSIHSFEITAVGTSSSTTILLPGVTSLTATYVGFGSLDEDIIAISIVNLPFPSPTSTTWTVFDLRVLPTPGAASMLLIAGLSASRRRRD